MLKTLNVPTSNISKLKENPTKLFEDAKKEKTGIYVFNRNTPAGIVLSVEDYEDMVHRLDNLEEELLDKEVQLRLKNNTKLFSDEDVRGHQKASQQTVTLDDEDGWE